MFFTADEEGAQAEMTTDGNGQSVSGIPPTFTEKPKIVPNEKGTLVTLKFKIKADPKPEIQWFKGMDKIQDSSKFSQKYTSLSATNEYEILLEIQDPSADDGGDYKCLVKNEMGQLQAKLNLNIEAEPSTPGKAATDAPTFIEKPKIVTLNDGKLVQLIVRYKATSKCTCSWFYKETLIQKSQSIQVFHEKYESGYECRLEIKDPGQNTAGMYKCMVSNDKGEINANLMLNIQMAASEATTDVKTTTKKTSTTSAVSVKKERRRSVILQCAVTGQKDVNVTWKKAGETLETTEQSSSSRFSVEKKLSEANQTIIQLEILDAAITDSGTYELVAQNQEGETQSQMVQLTEDQVKISLQTQEEADAKKKKKKKKKVKVEKKEIIAPEISSFLKNLILKEGENIEMKCRLEEEMEEADVTVTWFFNDTAMTNSERVETSFDGIFAKLFVASCKMADAGQYKVQFKNEKGEDETAGKVTVKPVSFFQKSQYLSKIGFFGKCLGNGKLENVEK